MKKTLEKRIEEERAKFSEWLQISGSSIIIVEEELRQKKGDFDYVLKEIVGINDCLESAADCARQKSDEIRRRFLKQARERKDTLYNDILRIYGVINGEGKLVSFYGIKERVVLWRDYLTQKIGGGIVRYNKLWGGELV